MKIVNIVSLDKKMHISNNYALQQVSKFYLLQGGWQVISDVEQIGKADKTYISILFTKSRPLAEQYADLPNVLIGGTGWNINSKLPPEIEAVRPKLNFGFTTRGCNRRCPFCFVPEKEGNLHVVGDLYDLWNGIDGADIVLMDNNILQAPDHFKLICNQAKKHKLRIDFNQGLDWRLFDEDTAEALRGVRLPPRLRISYDFKNEEEKEFFKHLQIIQTIRKEVQVYVLCGYNTTFIEDLDRLDYIWMSGGIPYVMLHENTKGMSEYAKLAVYCNSPGGYIHTCSFDDFKNRKYGKIKHISHETTSLEQAGFIAKKDKHGKILSWTLSDDWLSKNKGINLKKPRYKMSDEDRDCILEYFDHNERIEKLLKVVKRHDDFRPENLIIGGLSLTDVIKITQEKRKLQPEAPTPEPKLKKKSGKNSVKNVEIVTDLTKKQKTEKIADEEFEKKHQKLKLEFLEVAKALDKDNYENPELVDKLDRIEKEMKRLGIKRKMQNLNANMKKEMQNLNAEMELLK